MWDIICSVLWYCVKVYLTAKLVNPPTLSQHVNSSFSIRILCFYCVHVIVSFPFPSSTRSNKPAKACEIWVAKLHFGRQTEAVLCIVGKYAIIQENHSRTNSPLTGMHRTPIDVKSFSGTVYLMEKCSPLCQRHCTEIQTEWDLRKQENEYHKI